MKKYLIASLLTAALFLGVASMASASGYCQQDRCHVVQYGETLFSIGRLYDVNPYHIAEANGLYNPNYIYAGQVLYIPYGSHYPWGCGYDDCGGGCGYDDCGGGWGYERSGYHGGGCGNDGCGGGWGYERSGYHGGGCGNDDCGGGCGYQDCYEKPVHYPSKCGYNDCYDKCGQGCNSGYYGYDYTGYYYGSYYPRQKQYSHTCGYDSNCW